MASLYHHSNSTILQLYTFLYIVYGWQNDPQFMEHE